MKQEASRSLRQLDQEWIELMKTAKAHGIKQDDIKQFLRHKTI